MSRYIAIGALCFALLSLAGAGFLQWRNWQLRDDLGAVERALAIKERQLQHAEEAAQVIDAHLSRMQDERRALDASIQDLRKREGYDAPLSPFLADVYSRM